MFDLFKDIDKYKGIPPYASEHFGVYQPLLGWQSSLTKKWLQRGGILIDPRIQRILDGRIAPGPIEVLNNDPREFLARPLQPGSGKSPYHVMLLKNLNSEVLKIIRDGVQAFVDGHNGRLPEQAEWNQIIDINNLMDADNGPLRRANDIIHARLQRMLEIQANGTPITELQKATAKQLQLQQMQYESQIAAFLLFHAEAQAGYNPDAL